MTEAEARTIERLRAGAGTYACGGYLAALDGLQRTEICTALIFDRLQRKMRTVETLHGEADGNWNQTFYLLYFRTLGDRQNQEAFLRLARKVPYKIVLRERLAPHAVEAMLLGASGLLELYRGDAYTLDLRRSFEYLAAKYGIEATDASEWALTEIRPANHPVLRLAQAAEFFAQDEFIMERAMACRTEEDVRRLFCIEAPSYWRTHHVPGAESDESPKRIGAFKANIIGINLVAVLQFAYGSYTGSERLRDSAHGRPPACVRATPSNRRPCCNWPPNTAPHAAARNVPSDGGSQKASPKIDKSQKMSIFVRFRTRTEKTINALWI